MLFGGPTDKPGSQRLLARSRAAGLNFVDTADVYNAGASEEILGELIGHDRHWWILATKVGVATGDGPNEFGLSRRCMIRACDASLNRLKTDYIDIYYLHREDFDTPIEETVRALGDLIAQGKIRYFGLSNYQAWRVAEICRLCDKNGIDRPIAIQPYYSVLFRRPEFDLLPACDYFGLGVVTYSPLARGVLSGKYTLGKEPSPDTRAGRQDTRLMQTEWRPDNLRIANELKAHAERRGMTAAQFAVAWLLNNKRVTCPIVGPRTEAQLDDYLGALEVKFTREDEELVDRYVVSGHSSTLGYNDPAYPIEGRVTWTA